MPSHSQAQTDDAILSAVLSGNRARAMLFHLRQYGGTPQDAWHAIRELAEIPNCERPSHDPHVDRVERYLRGRDTASSIKWNAAMVCIAAAGIFLITRGWPRMITGIESYWWPETTAVVTNVHYYGHSYRAQQRKVVRRYVDYEYAYEIDGRKHSETVVKQSYVEMFDGPQLRRGDVIPILFDAELPERSVHIRDMYQRALPVMFGLIVLLPPLGLLALSAFFEMTYRDLEKVDPVRTRLPRTAVFSGIGGQFRLRRGKCRIL